MAKTYRPYVPEQDLLLPPSLRDWLPEDHLAFFVSDLIDQLDLSAITAVYEDEDRGYPPYHPVMLTKVLVYAYCVGVFSSRQDPAAVGRRRGVPRAGGRQRTGLPHDRRFSQDGICPPCRASSSRCCGWRANWARRGSAAWRSTAARSKRTRRSTRR